MAILGAFRVSSIRRRVELVCILLTALTTFAVELVDLPLILANILCGVSIAASVVGFWCIASYRGAPARVAIHGASVPSDFLPSVGVHGANSTDAGACKHVQ